MSNQHLPPYSHLDRDPKHTDAKAELRINHMILIMIILSFTAFYCVSPLFFHKGLPDSHDAIFHLLYADRFKQGLENGFLYPRWVLDANYGYGGPHFIFYAPLSYYLYAAVKIFLSSPVTAMITSIWLGFFLSGITVFAALLKESGKFISLVVAIIYQIMPFHMIDLYERGNYAELFAFVWIPLIIFFLLRINTSGNRMNILGLGVSYAGLILTHLVSGFMTTFVIGIFAIYHSIVNRNKQVIIGSALGVLLALGLSSFYLLPAIFERQYVHIEYILECTFCDYKQNFLFTREMLNLPTYYVGIIHTVFALELIIFSLLVIFTFRHRQKLVSKASIGVFMLLFIGSCLLTTDLTKPLWAIMPFFPHIQFPWRWFLFMDVSICFFAGKIFMVKNMTELKKAAFRKSIFISIFIILMAFSSLIVMPNTRVISGKLLTEIIYTDRLLDYIPLTIEYVPLWVTTLNKKALSPVSVVSGEGRYEIVDWKTEHRIINVTSKTPILLRIATFYYPGWTAYLNGSEVAVKTDSLTGAMLIDIPQGNQMLELKFIDTPIRRYSIVLSLISLLGTVIALILGKLHQTSAIPLK